MQQEVSSLRKENVFLFKIKDLSTSYRLTRSVIIPMIKGSRKTTLPSPPLGPHQDPVATHRCVVETEGFTGVCQLQRTENPKTSLKDRERRNMRKK